jgi:hypothetical protein
VLGDLLAVLVGAEPGQQSYRLVEPRQGDRHVRRGAPRHGPLAVGGDHQVDQCLTRDHDHAPTSPGASGPAPPSPSGARDSSTAWYAW